MELKNTKFQKITCKSAIAKCGFPGGGLAINPYVGCSHACVYCYARFIKRFTGHKEPWGLFVDARENIAEVLKKQMQSPKFKGEVIYIGTVTDPYQPIEAECQLTRKVLEVLANYDNPVSILTKSSLVIRDIELLKKFKRLDVNFTVASLDEEWTRVTEPGATSLDGRLEAMSRLAAEGITVIVMMGPFWPLFSKPEEMFKKFKSVGVSQIFVESFNAVGGNFTGVEEVLQKHYPNILPEMKEIIFDKNKFNKFYNEQRRKLENLSKEFNIPTIIYFGQGHAASKFK